MIGHTASVVSVDITNDSKIIASSGRDNKVILWNAIIGTKI